MQKMIIMMLMVMVIREGIARKEIAGDSSLVQSLS